MPNIIIIIKMPNIIIGCIYKHPSANVSEFTFELESIIEKINEKKITDLYNGRHFLKYNDHSKTEEYLDMSYMQLFQ